MLAGNEKTRHKTKSTICQAKQGKPGKGKQVGGAGTRQRQATGQSDCPHPCLPQKVLSLRITEAVGASMTSKDNALGKRLLVVDDNAKAQEVRLLRLNEHGVEVHSVGTIEEARSSLRYDSYDLVLLAAREKPEEAIAFRREILEQNPKQRVGFLVGPPKYISFTFGRGQTRKESKSSSWTEKLKGRIASA